MSLKHQTMKLSFFTGAAVTASFIFHIILARTFGISGKLDCLFAALTLFSWLTGLNMFITSLYIPVFNDVKQADPQGHLRFVDATIKLTIALTLVTVAAVFFFDTALLRILAPGFDAARLDLTRELAHILVFALVFFSISNTVVLTLNAVYRYAVPAALDIVDPLFNIFAIVILVPSFGIKALALSYLVSNGTKAAALLVYLHRITGWRPGLCFYHPGLKSLVHRSSKMSVGGFIWSLRDLATRNIASRLGEGSVALYAYAEKIIIILIQLLINPLSKVYYSRISEWISKSRWDHARALFIRASRVSVGLCLFVASGLAVFLPSILRSLFASSRLGIGDINSLCSLFNLLLAYFIILAFENYLSRVIFALKRVGVVAACAVAGVGILWLSGTYLCPRFGIYGLAVAVVLSQAGVSLGYYMFTFPYLKVDAGDMAKVFFTSLVVAFVFFRAGRLAANLVRNDALVLLAVAPVWIAAYFAAAAVFLKEEIRILVRS